MEIKIKYDDRTLFDLDGTLIDSKPKIARDLDLTFKLLGTSITEEEAYTSIDWVGLAAQYGHDKEKFWDAFKKARQERSWENSLGAGEVKFYPDAQEVLEYMVGVKHPIGLVTRSAEAETGAKLDYFNLRKYFGELIGITPTDRKKAADKGVEALEVLAKMKPYSDSGVIRFVGDTEDDVNTANVLRRIIPNKNVKSVLVDRLGKPLTVNPDYIITRLGNDLLKLYGD